MKLNSSFTKLEISREQMENLYRSQVEAKRAGDHTKANFGNHYKIKEVTRSIDGRTPREFWQVIYRNFNSKT
jgi:hypothetical protein